MRVPVGELVDDLQAESAVLYSLLVGLEPSQWKWPTPAAGWNITDQVTHLAFFDQSTLQSLVDPVGFRKDADALVAGGEDYVDRLVRQSHSLSPKIVLDWIQSSRAALIEAYRTIDPDSRLPWYGPDMGVRSSITARIMETWAHGQDVADALGKFREPTHRLRHVAHLGVIGRPYSYAINNVPLPDVPIRVELTAPDGAVWDWGPRVAENRVSGTALDFCLAVTQRRNLNDLRLSITGEDSAEWMQIAQAYAGPPGKGRPASSRESDTR